MGGSLGVCMCPVKVSLEVKTSFKFEVKWHGTMMNNG